MMNIPEPQNLPALDGARVKLRPPVERGKEDRLAAGRDPEFRCYKKCGFIEEGLERESALIGGEWHSDVLISVLEQEYRKR